MQKFVYFILPLILRVVASNIFIFYYIAINKSLSCKKIFELQRNLVKTLNLRRVISTTWKVLFWIFVNLEWKWTDFFFILLDPGHSVLQSVHLSKLPITILRTMELLVLLFMFFIKMVKKQLLSSHYYSWINVQDHVKWKILLPPFEILEAVQLLEQLVSEFHVTYPEISHNFAITFTHFSSFGRIFRHQTFN